ncbi:hypothetical protein C1645_828363 [Glomus cerebriforme]|uniref:Uncharacterized protein n=1 Tax=Glomus cerebriforme TaxID=658196 RepID=A0A397SLK4_9GLOM|nr:hypothetical protein C1645_828363 [Glomus cerebriforme]
MEFDNKTLVYKLVVDILFILIFICLDQILIVISKISILSCEGYYEDEYTLDIYNEDIKLYYNKDTTSGPRTIYE